MQKRKNAGFTLVELVIVIAILAILGGIGALAYNGYIDHAKTQADEELLYAVNTAFASACEKCGVDRQSLKHDQASLSPGTSVARIAATSAPTGAETIGGVEATFLEGDDRVAFENAFKVYFEGNETTPLQSHTLTDIKFAGGNDLFTMDIEKYKGAITGEAVGSFNNSNFQKDVDGLIGSVEGVTSLFSQLVDSYGFEQCFNLVSILSNSTPEEIINALAEYGVDKNSTSAEVANAMVLYVAHLTSTADTTALADSLVQGKIPEDQGIVAIPMTIGILTAYYNSDYSTPEFKATYDEKMKSPSGILDMILDQDLATDPHYKAYKESEDYRNDIEGYLGALTLVEQNKDSVDLKDPNAFSNDEFMDLIKSILGGGN